MNKIQKFISKIFNKDRDNDINSSDKNKLNEINNVNLIEEIIKENSKICEEEKSNMAQIKIMDIEPSLKDSKLGGVPYWPKGKNYPLTSTGNKLRLLAQINCADVPFELGWPHVGIVQFFIDANDDLYGANFEDPTDKNGFRLEYHEDIHLEHEEHSIDSDIKNFPLHFQQAKKIDFTLKKMLPDIDLSFVNPNFKNLFEKFEGEYFDFYYSQKNILFGENGEHHLGGYPHFTQFDPRNADQAQSTFAITLLQMDTDDEHQIHWGDYGRAYFFISSEALKNKDFSKVMYTWDCQ